MSKFRRGLMTNIINLDNDFFIAVAINSASSNNMCWSYDSGNTWYLKSTGVSDNLLSVSKDLQTWSLTGWGANSYFSLDGGLTFQSLPIRMDFASMSIDGNVIYGDTQSRHFYKTYYPFTSYSEISVGSVNNDMWVAPSINHDGSFWGFRPGSGANYRFYKNDAAVNTYKLSASSYTAPTIAPLSNYIYIPSSNGVYRSTDNGATFQIINNAVMLGNDGRNNIVSGDGKYLCASNDTRTASAYGGWVYVSNNYGETFTKHSINARSRSYCSISGKHMAYSVAYDGVYVSTDYGQSFNKINLPQQFPLNSGDLMVVVIEDIPEKLKLTSIKATAATKIQLPYSQKDFRIKIKFKVNEELFISSKNNNTVAAVGAGGIGFPHYINPETWSKKILPIYYSISSLVQNYNPSDFETMEIGKIYEFEMKYINNTVTGIIDGQVKYQYTDTRYVIRDLYLFSNIADEASLSSICYCKVYSGESDDSIVYDLVPYDDKNTGVVGFKNLVNNQIITGNNLVAEYE